MLADTTILSFDVWHNNRIVTLEYTPEIRPDLPTPIIPYWLYRVAGTDRWLRVNAPHIRANLSVGYHPREEGQAAVDHFYRGRTIGGVIYERE